MIDASDSLPMPPDEGARLADLHGFEMLDTPAEEPFDSIAEIAAALLDAPACALGFLDEERFGRRAGASRSATIRSSARRRW